MKQFEDIPLFCIRRFQEKPLIQNQDNWICILRHDFFVVTICPCCLQINKQIRESDILGIEILLTSLHAKGTGHVCFTTACSTGDKKISVFRYIFASCKSVNEILVKLASGSVIDIYDICFRLVESSIMD